MSHGLFQYLLLIIVGIIDSIHRFEVCSYAVFPLSTSDFPNNNSVHFANSLDLHKLKVCSTVVEDLIVTSLV